MVGLTVGRGQASILQLHQRVPLRGGNSARRLNDEGRLRCNLPLTARGLSSELKDPNRLQVSLVYPPFPPACPFRFTAGIEYPPHRPLPCRFPVVVPRQPPPSSKMIAPLPARGANSQRKLLYAWEVWPFVLALAVPRSLALRLLLLIHRLVASAVDRHTALAEPFLH